MLYLKVLAMAQQVSVTSVLRGHMALIMQPDAGVLAVAAA